MLTFPTSIIEPGSWRDQWFKTVRFLKNPWNHWKFKEITKKLSDKENNSKKSFYLTFPFEIPEEERVILDCDSLPEPVVTNSETGRMFKIAYFTKDGKRYYTHDEKNNNRAYLCIDDDKCTYMTWLPEKGWFPVDKFQKTEKGKWGRWVTVWLDTHLEHFWNVLKKKSFDFCMNTIRFFYRCMHTVDSVYLCLRYPFLYPRNRFNDKHYNNWRMTRWSDDLNKKYSFLGDVYFMKDGTDIPEFVIGSKSPEVFEKKVQNPENPDKPNIQDTLYYIKNGDTEYTVVRVSHLNRKKYYPIYVGNEYAIYDLDNKEWVSLEGQKYNLYSFNNKSDDYECRSYTVIRDELMIGMSKAIMFVHDHIVAPLFFIPTYTELDSMPEGWRRAFGMDMMNELRKQLKSEGQLYKHRITDIKEKFGGLRYYIAAGSREVYVIISKYEEISYKTCIVCGKPARYITSGWICPYCENCIDEKYIDSAKDLTKKYVEDDEEHEDFEAAHI